MSMLRAVKSSHTALHKGSVKFLLPSCAEDNRRLGPFWIAAVAMRVGSDSCVAFMGRNPLAVGWRIAP